MIKVVRFLSVIMLALPFLFSFQSNAHASANNGLIDYAKKQEGVPYVWGGTTSSGFDCSGFVSRVFREYGIKLPRSSAEQFNQGESINREDLLPGDLVFFTTYKKGASHAGIYIGNNEFIHADSSKGVTITSMSMPYFKKRFVGAKRYIH